MEAFLEFFVRTELNLAVAGACGGLIRSRLQGSKSVSDWFANVLTSAPIGYYFTPAAMHLLKADPVMSSFAACFLGVLGTDTVSYLIARFKASTENKLDGLLNSKKERRDVD